MCTELHDLFVRSAESEVQKAQGVEQRVRCVPERLQNGLLRYLGGLRAVGMPTHSVDHDEQRRILRRGYGYPVLVLLATAKEADIGVLHPQEEFRASVRLGVLYITLTIPSVVPATLVEPVWLMSAVARPTRTGRAVKPNPSVRITKTSEIPTE
jgi:hypothetical protein